MSVEWTIGKGGGTSVPPSSSVKKIPYIPKQRKKDDMTEAAKRGIDQWNMMVDKLRDHNLMEDQGGG